MIYIPLFSVQDILVIAAAIQASLSLLLTLKLGIMLMAVLGVELIGQAHSLIEFRFRKTQLL